jgi:plasmid stability protein
MRERCYDRPMGTLMQIRDMPEDVRRRLKARAAGQGQSLSEYVRTTLTRDVSRPTPAELAERIAARGSVSLPEPSEVSVRRLRDEGE